MRLARSLAIVVALSAAADAQPADAPPIPEAPELTPAARLFEEGRALLDEGKPGEACTKFEASIELDPDAPGTLLNLGLCNEKLGRTATALGWFRKAQFRAAESGKADYEAAAKSKTIALVALVPAIRIELAHPAPAGATYLLDGHTVQQVDFGHLELDPSSHALEMHVTGKQLRVRVDFAIAAGEQKTVVIPVPAPVRKLVLVDRGAHQRWLAYGLGAAGLGLWVGSASISLYAKHEFEAAEHPEDRQHYTNLARFAGTSLFVGGTAAVVVATYLYMRSPAPTFVPIAGEHDIGLAVHGAF